MNLGFLKIFGSMEIKNKPIGVFKYVRAMVGVLLKFALFCFVSIVPKCLG